VTRPEVSVIIPTRDRWPLLATTLRGALSQQGVQHEVIVVDDGSHDETPERLAAVGDSRLRVLRHERSRGVSAARNTGIAQARGEWLAFLDDDDLWSPRKLGAQVAAARAGGATFAYSAAIVLDDQRRAIEVLPAPDPEGLISRLLPGNAIPAGASNVLASAAAVSAVGGFDESLAHFADWDLWIGLADRGRGAACPEVLMAYLQHERSMLVTDKSGLVGEFNRLARKHRAVSKRHGVGFDRAGLARWMAWGEGRAGHRARAARGYLASAALYARQRDRGETRRSAAQALASLRGKRFLDSGRPLPSAAVDDEPDWLALYR
jgi:glycosyltransferase involved in cell wall biosynthesis